MDHYKVLGLSRTATKDEIKQAFRKLAVKFHPDKHSLSPKPVKDDATRKFKQVSEAYEVLIDDHKRADYNIRNYQSNSYQNSGYGAHNGANYGGRTSSTNSGFRSYGYESRSGGNYGYGYSTRVSNLSTFEVVLRYMTTRSFLVNFAFAGVILGGSYIINKSGEALWKMHNPGKSFDDVMESVEKTKAVRDHKI